jgi:hypothetical protein
MTAPQVRHVAGSNRRQPVPRSRVATGGDGEPAAPESSPLRSALSVLTTLGPPVSVASALMLYFGWARTAEQARVMGLDVSLFGYSTQDYVIRSVSTLYLPLLVIGAVALGWLGVHRRLLQVLDRPSSRPRLRLAGRGVLALGVVAAVGAAALATLSPGRPPLLLPLVIAAGTAVAAYGAWLTSAAGGGGPALPAWQRALRVLLTSAVVTLALFWQASNYAGVVGRGYALQIARSVPDLPRATVFTAAPLGIQAPGVQEERVQTGPDGREDQPRYRTTGLRLLTRSGGRMFLLHDGWTPRTGTVVVLPDDDHVRWQFSR